MRTTEDPHEIYPNSEVGFLFATYAGMTGEQQTEFFEELGRAGLIPELGEKGRRFIRDVFRSMYGKGGD